MAMLYPVEITDEQNFGERQGRVAVNATRKSKFLRGWSIDAAKLEAQEDIALAITSTAAAD
jgi:hypothetical protein